MRYFQNLSFILLFSTLISCDGNKTRETVTEIPEQETNVVEITAEGMTFEAPDSIASGWVTFRFNNPSGMIHFVLVQKYPEGKGIEDHQREIAPVFQNYMDIYNGKELSAPEAGVELPEWNSEIRFLGGPGLLSPDLTSESVVNLSPGTYVLECYIKTNGVFHSYNPSPDTYGMVHQLTVTADSADVMPPEATLSINVSEENGIEFSGNPSPGEHWVSVMFEDQKSYENFVGHDVHLVKLSDTTNIDRIAEWMNWTNPNGMQTPAPAEFIGGTNEMSQGNTTYFKVNLESGRYAWISEVPDPASHGLLVEFEVRDEVALGN